MRSWRVGRCVRENGQWRMTNVPYQDMSERAAKFLADKHNRGVRDSNTKYVAWDAGVVTNPDNAA